MSKLSKQCLQKAEKDGFASLMNGTKWREVCMAFAAFEVKPAWRTQDFLNGYLSRWDLDWFYHVGPDYYSIEWLEIDPRTCSKSEIREVLETVGVSFEDTNYFKVFGYKK